SDEPIAKAQIKLYQIVNGKIRPADSTSRVLNRNVIETDSRGIYRIAGLSTGEYVVRASESDEGGNPDEAAEGSYTDGSLMVAFHPKALRAQDATSVQVQQGSETRDVDIRLVDRIPHRVSGIVVVRGKPIYGAEIKLIREEPNEGQDRYLANPARSDHD